MPEAAIALGSNLGDRARNLRDALDRLKSLGTLLDISTFHDTPPVGYVDQPRFLNAAATLVVKVGPLALMQGLLDVERAMGRVRDGVPAKGPRLIDLDLVLYDDVILHETDLTLPHPEMHLRSFVLDPLAEIAPHWVHPVFNKTVAQLQSAIQT